MSTAPQDTEEKQTLLVSPTESGAFRDLDSAMTFSTTSQSLVINVAPGEYKTSGYCVRGCPVVIKALGDPGAVTILCTGDFFMRCETDVTLDGLIVKGWGQDESDYLISIMKNSATVRILNCTLENTKRFAIEVGGGASAELSHTTINGGFIGLRDGKAQLFHCLMKDEKSAVGLALLMGSTAAIAATTIQNQNSEQRRLVIVEEDSQLTMRDCAVEANDSGILLEDGSKALIEGCQVSAKNKDYPAFHMKNSSALTMSNCTVDANGTGIWLTDSSKALIEGCQVSAKNNDYSALVMEDNSQLEMGHSTITGGDVGIVARGASLTVIDSVTLENADECAIQAFDNATVQASGTNTIRSAFNGIMTGPDTTVSDTSFVFDDITNARLVRFERTANADGGFTKTFSWRDNHGKPWKLIRSFGVDGEQTSEQRIEPAQTGAEVALSLQPLMDELDALIGLDEVKTRVHQLVSLVQLNQMRTEQGLPPVDAKTNLVFVGNPGTGKTTVARLYGRILAALGVSRTGQVVEVTRTDLVGQYLGETGQKTLAKIKEALGGVLFVDEAYSLARQFGANKDFGTEAIDTLVAEMENHRDDLVVIVAGYQKEMREFFDANSGLASRFGAEITFANYSLDEMVEILQEFVTKAGFTMSSQTTTTVRQYMSEQLPRFSDGNAREVRKLAQAMEMAQASRLTEQATNGAVLTKQDLMELLPSDMSEWVAGQ